MYSFYKVRHSFFYAVAVKLKHSKTHSLEYYTWRGHVDYVCSCLQGSKPYLNPRN